MKYDTNLRTENYNYDNNIKDLKERYNLNDLDIFTLEEQAPRLVKKLNNGELIQSLFELSELVYTGILARGSILNLLSEVEEKISKHLDMYGKGNKVSKKFHKAMKFSMARKDVDNIIRPESINTESSNINNGKQSIGLATTTAASVYAYNKDKKSCSKLKGDAKTKCLKDASGSGLAVTTSQSKDCDKTKNPEKCKAKLNKEMNNWQKKMSIAEDMGGDTGGAAGGWGGGNSASLASYESPATIKVKKKKIQKRIGEIYFNKKKIKKPKESGEQKDNGEPQNQTDDWQVNSLADYGSDQIGGVV